MTITRRIRGWLKQPEIDEPDHTRPVSLVDKLNRLNETDELPKIIREAERKPSLQYSSPVREIKPALADSEEFKKSDQFNDVEPPEIKIVKDPVESRVTQSDAGMPEFRIEDKIRDIEELLSDNTPCRGVDDMQATKIPPELPGKRLGQRLEDIASPDYEPDIEYLPDYKPDIEEAFPSEPEQPEKVSKFASVKPSFTALKKRIFALQWPTINFGSFKRPTFGKFQLRRKPRKKRLPNSKRGPGLFKTWFDKRFPKASRSWAVRAGMFVGYWGLVCSIWITVILASLVTIYSLLAEDPLKAGLSQKPAKLTILANSGKVIAEKGLRRSHVSIEEMPPHLVQAVLATEDRRFYYHFGFDPLGILRAGIANYRAGRIVQGGSTITQQLVKVLFLKPERTYWRKIEEVLLALSLEYRFDKNQILELYLNRIYFGGGNNGVEAAAQHYFGKNVSEISIYESAIIAGLIKSPSYFSPTRNYQRSLDRGRVVLMGMLETGDIDLMEYDDALTHPPSLRTYMPNESYGFIIDWVVQTVSGLGQNMQQDMIVQTTIDYDLQGAAQKIINENMTLQGKEINAGQAAAVILDRNGAVKALVGGRDYRKNQFNRAVQARRQPGSTFKPFVYLAAMEKGLKPDSLIHDGPLRIGEWTPRNYNNRYYGDVTMREGLAKSLNTVSVRLAEWAGRDNVIRTAHRLGINSDLKNNPSIALGTSEVSLLELTSAYVPFSNGGFGAQPHIISSISKENGKLLFKLGTSNWGRVMEPHHVAAMNDMLTATINYGTGKKASLDPHPAAGKTGTGQDYRDAWFVGYTAHYVTGVWVGNDDFKPMKRVTGGSLPTMIWHDLMQYAHQDKQFAELPGGNWQYADNWAPQKQTSFWDKIFGGSSSQPDSMLGTRTTSAPGRKKSRTTLDPNVFWSD